MLKPSLRLFILPLGAVSMIASLSSQNAPQAGQRDMLQQVRQDIVACSANAKADICIVSEKSAR